MFKCILYLRQTLMGLYTDGHEGVLDEAGGKQHNITEAAPNELVSQALQTSNEIIFKLLLLSLSKIRTLEPAFTHMQVLWLIDPTRAA